MPRRQKIECQLQKLGSRQTVLIVIKHCIVKLSLFKNNLLYYHFTF